MDKPRFTPGEWYAARIAKPYPDRGFTDDFHVGFGALHTPKAAKISGENAEANAIAIAALPDLYAAIEKLVTLKDNRPADYETQKPLAWAAARAALAKAKGE